MKSQEEILSKIEAVASEDFFGVIRTDLIEFLTYENAKPFLNDVVTEEQWLEDVYAELTVENVKKKMRDYLDFAFKKARNGRGLSAGRSMDHYSAWIWLLGEEDRFGDVTDYDNYGLPHLEKIKEFLAD